MHIVIHINLEISQLIGKNYLSKKKSIAMILISNGDIVVVQLELLRNFKFLVREDCISKLNKASQFSELPPEPAPVHI